MKKIIVQLLTLLISNIITAQHNIPLDTINWKIISKAHVFENYQGKNAIYLQAGAMTLKNTKFLNGTIEFDIFLKEEQAFPGLYFRVNNSDAEQWFIRPHLSGKPDANQAAPVTNGITPWQLYFGIKYSFKYEYKYDDWTHVKLVVKDAKAQVFLDNSTEPNLSWNLFLEPKSGDIIFRGGIRSGIHIANISVDKNKTELKNFKPNEREPIEGLISEWEISDMFEEKLLEDPKKIKSVSEGRTWGRKIQLEEGTAANISRVQVLRDGNPGETVFAKLTIHSDKDQIKLFHFGYSDRVIAILNGTAIYKGDNGWRTRDYRYLGTIAFLTAYT